MMFSKYVFILFVLSVSYAKDLTFRFDYDYISQADGWLKLHLVPSVWSDARLRCHAEGAVLASPLTLQLRSAITRYVSSHSSIMYIFTGVHATFFKGAYASVEGVPLSRLSIDWEPSQPDNYMNSESCIAMSTADNSTMTDVRCTDVFPYVCYKKRVPVVMTGCGTTDPEYNLEVRTGSCYKFHRWGLTWPQAYMTCLAEGAYLAIVNSELESTVLAELHTKHQNNVIFSKNAHIAAVGFLDWRDGGSWMTIHGQTLIEAGFNRWWENGPDNVTRGPNFSSEFCGSIVRTGVVNDVACDVAIPFICEKKPESLESFDNDG